MKRHTNLCAYDGDETVYTHGTLLTEAAAFASSDHRLQEMDKDIHWGHQSANTSTATLVEPPAGPSNGIISHMSSVGLDFTRREGEVTLNDTHNLGLRVLLPNPVRHSILPSPRLSVRQIGHQIPPRSPLKTFSSARMLSLPLHGPTPAVHSDQEVLVPYLRRPLLPVIHILLIAAHLAFSTAIPYLLVKHLIQPMILWLILVVCLVLQTLYLAPGIVLEIIGMIRGRPM